MNETQGSTKLTNTLTHMMRAVGDKPPCIDLGIINSDFSLTTNSFPKPIPKTDYSVCRQLLYEPSVPLTKTYVDGKHTHNCGGPCDWPKPSGEHFHEVLLPPKMRKLLPGDKVLVAIIQNEFIVIDIVYSAKYLGTPLEPNWGVI